jgi:hypothetical protein
MLIEVTVSMIQSINWLGTGSMVIECGLKAPIVFRQHNTVKRPVADHNGGTV